MTCFPPVNITVIFSFIIFIFYLLGIHDLLTSFTDNGCEMTYMFEYPQFVEISLPPEIRKSYPKYALYGYGEGGFTEELRKMKFSGVPVLFIPGSSGSHKQGRSLASVSLRKSLNSRTSFHFDYFMIDFNEEQAGIFGPVLQDQTKFTSHCIKKILTLYHNNSGYKVPESVILIGHSLGGLLTKGIFINTEFDPRLVYLIITLATPHKYPLIQPDYYITSYYQGVANFWRNNSAVKHINLISVGGGFRDLIVRSDVTYDPYSDINVLTNAIPGVWLPNDHLSIMWCKQLVLTIVRAIFDSIDISTKQLSTDKEYIRKVFEYHLLKRWAGKKFSGSSISRYSSFERSPYWFENLQRQFTVTESKGLKNNHYIMIRLFSDPKSEVAFIEAYNLNIKDWIFVCLADVVYKSIRMCDTGENISNFTEIAPINPELQLKRKFVYLNLLEFKAKSFTHVLIRFPPSGSFMSVNVDVHQASDRNIKFQVPKFYSLTPKTIIESTKDGAAYYSISLIGFEHIWQSYTLRLYTKSCKTNKNNAVVSFISPWAKEDQHFMFNDPNVLYVTLNLGSPKPKNFNGTASPLIRLHLDVTCKYGVTIQPSILGIFSQGVRYYSFMLPAFLGTVVLLTLRQQLIFLDYGQSVLFHSALSSAVRRYYLILQATILGSKFLGLGFCLAFLPVPDFMFLQEVSLDSFFLTVFLYAVAIVLVYILGAACYLIIIVSGQAAHKMALRFLAKALSGVFNWSDWIISGLHQVPFFVSIILISLAVSKSGALSLCLGTFFYFLKLCKMYEEYLEEWFNYSIKILAQKVKSAVGGSKPKQSKIENENENKDESDSNNKTISKTNTEIIQESEPVVTQSSEENESNKASSLSAIHFHVTVFLVWVLTTLLYTPSLLVWAKNYHYNFYLENDPALVPSIIVCCCGAILWQSDNPKPCRKLTMVTSSCLSALAVISIIYASTSLYRLGYILAAGLVVLSLNQILASFV